MLARQAAYWYAIARNDAAGTRVCDSVDFMEHYEAMNLALILGTSSHLPSIQDAWQQFAVRGCVPDWMVDDDMSRAESAQARGWES
jgi:hypothetical protein